MEYKRDTKNNKILAVENTTIKSKKDFIVKMIELFSVLNMSKDVWLSEREKDFFVVLIINHSEGIKYTTDSGADENFIKYFGSHNKKERSTWLKKIKLKGWVIVEDKKILIPPFFKALNLKGDDMDFKINYKYVNVEEEQG